MFEKEELIKATGAKILKDNGIEKDFSISEFSVILVIFETFHNFRINGDRRTD